jgi:hypothetical protein
LPAPRNRKHLLVPTVPTAERYRPHPRKIDPPSGPPAPASRSKHAKALERALKTAVTDALQRRHDAGIEVHGAEPGLYVQFESQPGVPLELGSLESAHQGIELVAVRHVMTTEETPRRIEQATVFVPDGKVGHFLKRFEAYAKTAPKKKGEQRHEKMLDPVATLRLATLRGLWTDATEAYPDDENAIISWEVWLRRQEDDGSELGRLMEFAVHQELEVAPRRLQFEDRTVTLVRASRTQLAASIDVLNDIAELRRAKQAATVFIDMGPDEQGDWTKELLERTKAATAHAPAVCVLDTGVNRGHPLLASSLDAADCHAYDPTWGTHDHDGHGTEMAGLALYGDLSPHVEGTREVALRHILESVKILPVKGVNPPDLYGAITADATSRVEIQAPTRKRTFSMAVTATDERDRGQPTSWSAAVDALAAGRAFDPTTHGLDYLDDDSEPAQRLFVISAGNVAELRAEHLDGSDTDPVHDPGQAWNALTVGGFTDKAVISDPKWKSWLPVARAGDLSPWSTTGVAFAETWPIKPDVVFEAGNVVKNAKGEIDFPCPDLSLLSTHYKPAEKSFVLSWATSAATAQAAQMAALITAEYPQLWPESVRALIVHSAEWTAQMKAALQGAGGKRARARLVRRYGFGVPSAQRALRSANDALTLVTQGTIRPFAPKEEKPNERQMGDIHFFELPWPRDVLQGLGETPVRLRVTLSYFIEPNPGRRGWKKRHRYASHGLRFDVKGPTESMEEFRKRLNKKALEEDEEKPHSGGDSSEWYLGETARNRGSIHSDILQGFAADLAERGVIAIYPVSGWWKDQPKRDRSDKGARYALVISIETPGVETDIWTPVAQKIGAPIAIET